MSWLAGRLMAVTGKTDWKTAPATTLEAAKAHADSTAPHSATSAATADRLMLRDAAGRAKVAAPSASDDIARKDTVDTAIANLLASAPGTLDTLNELAAALGNDPNFATTITNALAGKAPLASPALTGTPTAPTAGAGTNTTQLATTAFVASAVAAVAPALTSFYQSGELSIATATTVSHLLGTRPFLFQAVIRCLISDAGYSPADEVELSTVFTSGSYTTIASVWVNTTSMGYASTSVTWAVRPKTGGAPVNINHTNWRVVMRAWR
jgi:hypothetical protein